MEKGRLDHALKWCENSEILRSVNQINYKELIRKKEERNIKANKYHREYRKRTIKNLLTDRIRGLVYYSLKRMDIKKAGRLKIILGYSIKQLENRLNKTMPVGYTWNDFLTGKLDIDHIRPIKLFDYNSQEDPKFKKCWALSNLRLLTIHDNRSRKFKGRG